MTLSIEEKKAIVMYRVEKAYKTMRDIEALVPLKQWNTMANRLYYSAYYMVSALLIKNDNVAHTHAGVKNLFALHFIKTGILNTELFYLYTKLFEYRLKGDYDDFFDLDEKQIFPLIEPTKELLERIEELIKFD